MNRLLLATLVSAPHLSALTIQIDYTYDTTNFFDTQEKRDAIEAVAKFYSDLIHDNLLRIDASEYPGNSWTARPFHPATGLTIEIPNLVVPEDTMIVYVGARDLGSSLGIAGPGGFGNLTSGWTSVVRARGNPGADFSTPNAVLRTDFAPWGGSISFDIDSTWNFSQDQNLGGADFIPIALHEMAHVLGIGTASSWFNNVSVGTFMGVASVRSFGSAPPVQSGNGHFGGVATGSKAFGSFGVTHGTEGQLLMLPMLVDDGETVLVARDLDLAALVDIGWELAPPHQLTATSLGPAGTSFKWATSSFFDYKIQRGTMLQAFPDGSGTIPGNGSIQSWIDPAPPSSAAFYRLAATEYIGPPPGFAPTATARALLVESTESEEPRVVTGCGVPGH